MKYNHFHVVSCEIKISLQFQCVLFLRAQHIDVSFGKGGRDRLRSAVLRTEMRHQFGDFLRGIVRQIGT